MIKMELHINKTINVLNDLQLIILILYISIDIIKITNRELETTDTDDNRKNNLKINDITISKRLETQYMIKTIEFKFYR